MWTWIKKHYGFSFVILLVLVNIIGVFISVCLPLLCQRFRH